MLKVHDTVRTRSYESPLPSYDPNFHPQTQVGGRHGKKGLEYRTIGLHKSSNEPLVREREREGGGKEREASGMEWRLYCGSAGGMEWS